MCIKLLIVLFARMSGRPEKIHNLPRVKPTRVRLRKKLTPAEASLWNVLKNSKFHGRKFRRQHSVGKYVLDFYCPSELLAVELDGQSHASAFARMKDRERTLFLSEEGIKVLRFENKYVFEEIMWVLAVIESEFNWWKKEVPPPNQHNNPK